MFDPLQSSMVWCHDEWCRFDAHSLWLWAFVEGDWVHSSPWIVSGDSSYDWQDSCPLGPWRWSSTFLPPLTTRNLWLLLYLPHVRAFWGIRTLTSVSSLPYPASPFLLPRPHQPRGQKPGKWHWTNLSQARIQSCITSESCCSKRQIVLMRWLELLVVCTATVVSTSFSLSFKSMAKKEADWGFHW